jgi:hypothetical protein
MLEKLTKVGVSPRQVRIALLTMFVLVVLSGQAAAAPEQCSNPEIWDFVKWMGGCPSYT